jgi:hypothetical protein
VANSIRGQWRERLNGGRSAVWLAGLIVGASDSSRSLVVVVVVVVVVQDFAAMRADELCLAGECRATATISPAALKWPSAHPLKAPFPLEARHRRRSTDPFNERPFARRAIDGGHQTKWAAAYKVLGGGAPRLSQSARLSNQIRSSLIKSSSSGRAIACKNKDNP